METDDVLLEDPDMAAPADTEAVKVVAQSSTGDKAPSVGVNEIINQVTSGLTCKMVRRALI